MKWCLRKRSSAGQSSAPRYLSLRTKKSLGAVKRSIYFGNTLSLEDGLQLEHAEFLVRDQSKDAQGRMLEYIATTESTGELPLLDRQKYAHALRVGRFGGQPGR